MTPVFFADDRIGDIAFWKEELITEIRSSENEMENMAVSPTNSHRTEVSRIETSILIKQEWGI